MPKKKTEPDLSTPGKTEAYWNKEAAALLAGRTIKEVRYMTAEEAEDMGYSSRPVMFVLDNGLTYFPMADDEGNDGGALGCGDGSGLPVLR